MFLFPVQMIYYIIRASLSSLLPSRRKDLTKEVVLITGGGRGIGRHLAKEFAKQGARKVNPPRCRQLVAPTSAPTWDMHVLNLFWNRFVIVLLWFILIPTTPTPPTRAHTCPPSRQ